MTSRLAWGATEIGFAMWSVRKAGLPPADLIEAFTKWFWTPPIGDTGYEGVDRLVREFGLE